MLLISERWVGVLTLVPPCRCTQAHAPMHVYLHKQFLKAACTLTHTIQLTTKLKLPKQVWTDCEPISLWSVDSPLWRLRKKERHRWNHNHEGTFRIKASEMLPVQAYAFKIIGYARGKQKLIWPLRRATVPYQKQVTKYCHLDPVRPGVRASDPVFSTNNHLKAETRSDEMQTCMSGKWKGVTYWLFNF